ncbi:hypothetical protein OZ664_13020 [Elizabethkingia sp. HX WHF]|uniref:hypothetical protein n=1 Tax=Elizabethkingia TaxID=308865 RepID=UPI0020121110|nr:MULTISPECIES: hypothetical protein [Elizabethkingia]MCL1639368.1 hypothetical protein [Elizabethkingia bruuniana]MDX8564922.1 hypothetical protein [Elizabethkingia sp. HX WHF]
MKNLKNMKRNPLTRTELKNISGGGTQTTCADVNSTCRSSAGSCNFSASYSSYAQCFSNYTKVHGNFGYGPLSCWEEICPY